MHPEELGHGKDHARIPREDSEGHEDHVKENTGHDKHSQLRIPVAEWFLPLRTILRKPTLFERTFPCTKAFEFHSHVPGCAALIIFRVDLGAFLEKPADANFVPAYDCPMQG
jgi:hypothetical protein